MKIDGVGEIRNIYCVGRNYRLHAAELGNEVPASPMLFVKPTHAATAMDGRALALPDDRGAVHFETELVLAAARAYEPGIRFGDMFAAFTVGLDLTLRDVQEKLKAKGQPWLAAKGFNGSAPLGRWLPLPDADSLVAADFTLRVNGTEVQRGNVRDMVFDLQRLTDHVGREFGIGAGDLLFTGTPAGVGRLRNGDRLEVAWGDEKLGDLTVLMDGGKT